MPKTSAFTSVSLDKPNDKLVSSSTISEKQSKDSEEKTPPIKSKRPIASALLAPEPSPYLANPRSKYYQEKATTLEKIRTRPHNSNGRS